MNLAEYHIDKDENGFPLVCYTPSSPPLADTAARPTTEFVCYVDAAMTMHDLMLKIQQFDHHSQESNPQ